jgi:hypothetical protein
VRGPGEVAEPLGAAPLSLAEYEAGRPPPEAACRIGDARVLAMRAGERSP